jgi:signal transduction histidine kinase
MLKFILPALQTRLIGKGDRRHAIEASLTEAVDLNGIVLANLPAGPTERRIAFAVGLGILGIAAAVAPFASVQLPRIDAWTPITNTYVFFADLATSALLISQFDIVRRPALLVLASGYLFTAVMGVPLLLSFPGAFTPTGLLGAGLQTTGWLSAFWVAGYPLAAICYAVLKDREPGALVSHGSSRTSVAASVAVSLVIVLALTWTATAGEPYLPKLFLDGSRATVNLRYVGALLLLLNAVALLLLWLRRRSVIGLWLMVVLCGSIANALVGWILTPGRFSLAFYAGRSFVVITATVMLIVLLTETMTLYARLAVSILAQRRERESRIMTMEALAASIAHELNQPLAAVVGNGSAGLRWLDRPVPDLSEVRASLQRIVRDGHRAAEVIESIRSLFQVANNEKTPIFINAIVLEALDLLGAELRSERVHVVTDLAADLPMMSASKGQLQQVILNLVTNAVEAMRPIADRARVLKVSSTFVSGQGVLIDITDSGTGIEPKDVDGLFEAFFTTKAHGTGMGLAICRSIVEAHGGRLSAAPNEPHGAVFRFTLPVEDASSPQLVPLAS